MLAFSVITPELFIYHDDIILEFRYLIYVVSYFEMLFHTFYHFIDTINSHYLV